MKRARGGAPAPAPPGPRREHSRDALAQYALHVLRPRAARLHHTRRDAGATDAGHCVRVSPQRRWRVTWVVADLKPLLDLASERHDDLAINSFSSFTSTRIV
ncbi:hypothetical protein EVAR_45640_1 [Eumeta japonica]|uniref:Uncharacterized protein n=1 Tax=Eumeta variegata TaxID=151549 RepID=A0A4C1Y4T8_EUMVA|nr:hypothetical protein EVAR_45640_1 [Eumeta japonica]